MTSIPALALRVYAEDVDYMGIVYHANHLRFFERARTEFLRHLGWTLAQFRKENTFFAIHRASIDYHLPAKLDDALLITTQLSTYSAATFSCQQWIHHQKGHLISTLSVQVVCVSELLKPKRLPSYLVACFKKLSENNNDYSADKGHAMTTFVNGENENEPTS